MSATRPPVRLSRETAADVTRSRRTGIFFSRVMSIYRTFKRSPRSDVHHVAEHVTRPLADVRGTEQSSQERDWTKVRKAHPAQTLLPASVQWLEALPQDVRPDALASAHPRIVNMLARLWPNAQALTDYMSDLLVDRRGGRKGFPIEVLADLNRLRSYWAELNPDQTKTWDLPPRAR
jgi:hypothetical protein